MYRFGLLLLNLAEAKSSVDSPEDSSRDSCSRSHARRLEFTQCRASFFKPSGK